METVILETLRDVVSAIHAQTEALQSAVRGEDDLTREERALIILSRDDGEIDSLAKLARKMGLASSVFYNDTEPNEKVRRMFKSLGRSPVRKGFKTTSGIEAVQ